MAAAVMLLIGGPTALYRAPMTHRRRAHLSRYDTDAIVIYQTAFERMLRDEISHLIARDKADGAAGWRRL